MHFFKIFTHFVLFKHRHMHAITVSMCRTKCSASCWFKANSSGSSPFLPSEHLHTIIAGVLQLLGCQCAAIKKIKRQAGEKKVLLLRLGGHGAAVIKTTHLDACGAE
jgi:hypothetical protein